MGRLELRERCHTSPLGVRGWVIKTLVVTVHQTHRLADRPIPNAGCLPKEASREIQQATVTQALLGRGPCVVGSHVDWGTGGPGSKPSWLAGSLLKQARVARLMWIGDELQSSSCFIEPQPPRLGSACDDASAPLLPVGLPWSLGRKVEAR
jgi:hypothetical protein